MQPEVISNLTREAILLSLLLSAPIVGAAALVGLLLGILQALTQLQDQSTSYALKLLVVFALLALLAPWLGIQMTAFGARILDLVTAVR
jgi:type III secretion protein S